MVCLGNTSLLTALYGSDETYVYPSLSGTLVAMSLLLFCYGLVFGSFSNVLIDRLESGESVLWGRSHCDHCKKTLRWYELIPVLSFLIQLGKCRRCHHPLSLQYPLIELVTAVGYVWLYATIPFGLAYIAAAAIFSASIVILIADYKYRIIPDEMVVIGSVAAVAYILITKQHSYDIVLHIASALGAMAFFYALWFGTKGKGMGFGDVKLAAMLGLTLGYPGILFALYTAFLTGAMVGVILILTRNKTLKSKIAFGPFLLLGLLVGVVFERQLLQIWNMYF